MKAKNITGMTAFTVIWLGQVLSTLGTRMTNFALSVWIWQISHQVSALSLMTFCAFASTAIFSPLAGSLIDRWNRRLVVMISDIGSALATLCILILFITNTTQLWELYALNAITGAFLAFQMPAYSATISLMMPKKYFARANAMLSLVRSIPGIFAPTLAALALTFFDIQKVLAFDVTSYVVALGAVLLVAIPNAPPKDAGEKSLSFWQDLLFGFRYILQRPSLIGLEAIIFGIGLLSSMGWIVLNPMILARTGNNDTALGIVLSIGAIGGVIGGIVLGAVKSPKNKIPGFLGAILLLSIGGRILLGLGTSLVVWSVAWCCAWFCTPFINGYGQALWQSKVDPKVQGRVFASCQLIEYLALPLALATAGPLSDSFFEPGMRPGGHLAAIFGSFIQPGPGGGMALIFLFSGLCAAALGIIGYLYRPVRDLEYIIPDYDSAEQEIAEQPVLSQS